MHRRSLLSVLSAVLAGCTVRGTEFGSDVTRDSAEDGCPGFDDRADELVCAGTKAEGIQFAASDDTLSLGEDDAGLVFELTNRSEQSFSCNPYDWAVYRRNGPVWRRVAPDAVPEPLLHLAPGDSLRWRLRDASDESDSGDDADRTVSDGDSSNETVSSDETADSDERRDEADEERAYTATADLEPGTYAFSFSGSLGPSPFDRGGPSNGTATEVDADAAPRTRVECVATFSVE
ncbi:hypothetical protein [Haloprofundus halobius]|uniref:hypothetical protein n=1 Tax=Haloprofundus halobius TaxID=2876194 RepID=UPI001CCCDE6E|nr:hypothetical protein [Haloprofundus halobius]